MSSGTPSNIWIDHNTIFASLTECPGAGDSSFDGGIDLKKGANHITISYNYIHDYQKVALNGFSDSDTINNNARTTYHHNRFENVKSRLPLQRFGLTHVYNNYFKNVSTSGINVRMGGVSLIESNVFETVTNPVTSRDSSADRVLGPAQQPHERDHLGRGQRGHGERHELADDPGVRLDGVQLHADAGRRGQDERHRDRRCRYQPGAMNPHEASWVQRALLRSGST